MKSISYKISQAAVLIASITAGSYSISLQADQWTYTLPNTVNAIYPSATWLPDPYKQYYPDSTLAETILLFTMHSLQNDGIESSRVGVVPLDNQQGYQITIESNNPDAGLLGTHRLSAVKTHNLSGLCQLLRRVVYEADRSVTGDTTDEI